MSRFYIRPFRPWAGSLLALALAGPLFASADLGSPGGGPFQPPTDRISPATYQRIGAQIDRNAALLGLPAWSPEAAPSFSWPLGVESIGYFAGHAISNYVDHDLDLGELLDYDCGQRTYDSTDGYQHQGVDIYPWPYPWRAMDHQLVRVVAAAAGTIVAKEDGHDDRQCACMSGDANYVVVHHPDGSRAWYFHLKNGSVTAKSIGEDVVTGEVLGTIGSSGCSTGVHLHFEVHDAGTQPGPLLDPFAGACNGLNPTSLWSDQPAYRDPTVNHLSTHAAPPDLATCPAQETPNEKRVFAPGDDIHLAVFLHDETPDFAKTVEILRPDQSLFHSETHTTAEAASASYWYWSWTGGNEITSGPPGRWTWRVTIDGVARERSFWVGALFADDFEDANLDAWSAATP